MDFPSADQLFLPGKAPSALNAAALERLKQQPLFLMPRVTKQSAPTPFGDIRQAGLRGVLVDQNHRALYYASHVNQVYYDFVRSNRLYLKSAYLAADPNLAFPFKSLELKSSWRIVQPGENTGGFFTTQALINPLTCANGAGACTGANVVVDRTKVVPVTVALVGLHVVGVVQDHPEFVWATFEHRNNAPDLPSTVAPTAAQPVSPVASTFYAAGTPANMCNVLNSSTVALNPATQQLTPITNVFRQFAFGQGNPPDTANIQALNASVQAQLAPGDVWRNYFLVGSVWFAAINGLHPGLNGTSPAMQNLVTGSIHLSNSTMETFTQPTNVKKNCFACHDTGQVQGLGLPPMNLNLSHILQNGLLQRDEVATAARHLTAMRALAAVAAPPPLSSFNDVKNLLNTFVQQNNVPIGLAPHADFWNTLSYQQFTTGNIPNVTDPTTQMPMRILIPGNSADSNLINALRGTPGTVFDPNNGAIGRMPPSGPFMADQDIDRIANWIDRNCPQ
jgi:hypothetical protein